MQNQQTITIKRIAKPVGNGAHVFLPKHLINQEITINIKPKPPIRKQILTIIEPHLEHINGVYLYGSHARNEATPDSDIDVLIITNKPFNIKAPQMHITVLLQSEIMQAIEQSPLFMHTILREATPFLNPLLLREIKQRHRPTKIQFKKFIASTKRIININKTSLELDKETESKAGAASAYSLILRLRGVFLLNNIITNTKYTTKKFTTWLEKRISKEKLAPAIQSYKEIKSGKKGKDIPFTTAEALLIILKREVENHEKKEKTTKRN